MKIRIYSGSYEFLSWLNRRIENFLNVRGGYVINKEKSDSRFLLTFGKIEEVLLILAKIYENPKHFLKRKKDIVDPYLERAEKIQSKKRFLVNEYPELLDEWDYIKNSIDVNIVTIGMNLKAWWICPKGHSYEAYINNRTRKNPSPSNCPECYNILKKKVSKDKSIGIQKPFLIDQFIVNQNNLSVYEISAYSRIDVFWECEYGHKWSMPPKNRNDNSCLICTGNEHSLVHWSEQKRQCSHNECVNDYIPVWHSRKFCSEECKKMDLKNRRKNTLNLCIICNAGYYKRKDSKGRACSRKCAAMYRNRK